MFREFFGEFMGKRTNAPRPPVRESGLSNEARVRTAFSTPSRGGEGLDRESWTLETSATKAPEQPTTQPSGNKGNVFPLRPERHVPADPFEAQPLETDEIGGWSSERNPGLQEPF